ncbi:MAG: cysteine dioxygenase family protein [Pseudomonadota bacterium]
MPWLDEFASHCRQCIDDGGGPTEIQALVQQALEKHAADFAQTEIDRIVYRSADLFIVSLAQPPYGNTPIHNHGFWGVIGIADGCEENAFFERSEAGLLEKVNRVQVNAGEAIVLAPDAIHKIRNPRGTQSLGLHVYGGDLAGAKRRMWSPHTGEESQLEQSQFEAWCEELTAAAANPDRRACTW